jgi:hypothetical protein
VLLLALGLAPHGLLDFFDATTRTAWNAQWNQ